MSKFKIKLAKPPQPIQEDNAPSSTSAVAAPAPAAPAAPASSSSAATAATAAAAKPGTDAGADVARARAQEDEAAQEDEEVDEEDDEEGEELDGDEDQGEEEEEGGESLQDTATLQEGDSIADVTMGDSASEEEDELAGGSPIKETDQMTKAAVSARRGGRGSRGGSSVARGSPSTSRGRGGKRKNIDQSHIEGLTSQEIDALPAAKRRKGLKARGAPGPGRGWRKGLKMGQKPHYALPGGETPVAEGTPASFVDSTRASPASEATASPEPQAAPKAAPSTSTSTTTAPTTAAPKVAKASASAAAAAARSDPTGKTNLPSGRASQAVAAALGFGPPVKPPPKLLMAAGTNPVTSTSNASVSALNRDPEVKPRSWTFDEREIVNLGGRVIKLKTWWGGPDASYDPAAEREKEEAIRARAKADAVAAAVAAKDGKGSGGVGTGGGDESMAGSPKPGGSRHSTPKPTGTAPSAPGSGKGKGRTTGTSLKGGEDSIRAGSVASPVTGKTKKTSQAAAASAAQTPPTGLESPTPSTGLGQLPKPKFEPGGGGTEWRGVGVAGRK